MDPHSSAKDAVSSVIPPPPPPPPPAPPPPPPPDWRIAEKLETLIDRLGGKDDKHSKDKRKSSKRERPKSSRRKSSGQRSRQSKEDDPDTPPLAGETLALMEVHKGLFDLLIDDDGVIFNGLCELGDRSVIDGTNGELSSDISFAEQISGSLFRIFHCRGRHVKLLTKAIEREVHNSDMATTVLRRNSVSTKIISHFAREIGGRYLCRVMKPLCASIIASTHEELEVDPMQLGSEATPRRIAANMARLTARCQEVVNTIVNSVPRCPASMRVLCSEIKRLVLYKYPSEDSWREGVCGFIFLRFFCSALVTPEEYGLADFVPPQMRRRLILIAKVIQNLASGVRFGTKEQYMHDMNAFIDQATPAINQFYDRMTTPPRLMPIAIQPRIKRLDLLRSLFDLQCLVAIKKTRLFKAVEDTPKTTSEVLVILGKLQELATKLEKCSFIEELIQTDPDFNLRDWSVSPHSVEKTQHDSSLIEKSKVRNFTGEDVWLLNAWNDETIDNRVMQREKTLFRALSSKKASAKTANDFVLFLMEKLASLYEKHSTVNIHAKNTSPVKANRRKSSIRDSGIKHVHIDKFQLQHDPQFLEFSSLVAMLHKIELRNFSQQEKKVLFINIHNLLFLHITVLLGPIASKFKRKFFFKIFKYSIDKCSYSLEDIRDGILRGNVTVDEANKIKHFPKKDGRKQNVLNLDPRIHFALSCLTNSSPRVIFLALDRIDQQLEYAAQKFCTAITIDQASNTIYLPRVFQWYEADFVPKTNHTHADKVNLLRIVRHWITDKQMMQQIEQRLEQSTQGSDEFFRVEFRSFDWLLTPVTDLFDWTFCPTRRNSYSGSTEEPSEEMSEQQSEEM